MTFLWPEYNNGLGCYISPAPLDFSQKRYRQIAILGSTGSIGRSALKVAETAYPLKIAALAGGRNIELLAEQAVCWRPDYLAALNDDLAQQLEDLLPADYRPIIFWGENGYATMASLPEIDCVLSAQVGAAGLTGTLAAALAGKTIALANKESLVIAGSLLRKLCYENNASILPVDSEHFALFQCIAGRKQNTIKNLVLTASGGPFLGKRLTEIKDATPGQALKHPNWSMGAKISVDSATLMNKGLEFIEATHLFGLGPEQIRIVIHPQSIIHSLAEFQDESLLAQMAVPDMRLAIGACLCWPECQQSFIHPLSLAKIGQLTFSEPAWHDFPCLGLAMDACQYLAPADWQEVGMNPACIILNSANEAAVELFLVGQCTFGEIAERVKHALDALLAANIPPAQIDAAALRSIPSHAIALANLIAPLDEKAREIARAPL